MVLFISNLAYELVAAIKLSTLLSNDCVVISICVNLLSADAVKVFVDCVKLLNSAVSTKSTERDCVNASNEFNLLFCAVCSTSTDCVYVLKSVSFTNNPSADELKFSNAVILVSADCVNALIEVNELSVDDVNEFIAFNELSVEDVKELIDARELSTEPVYVANVAFLACCDVSKVSKLSNLESTDVENGPSNASNLLSTEAE